MIHTLIDCRLSRFYPTFNLNRESSYYFDFFFLFLLDYWLLFFFGETRSQFLNCWNLRRTWVGLNDVNLVEGVRWSQGSQRTRDQVRLRHSAWIDLPLKLVKALIQYLLLIEKLFFLRSLMPQLCDFRLRNIFIIDWRPLTTARRSQRVQGVVKDRLG